MLSISSFGANFAKLSREKSTPAIHVSRTLLISDRIYCFYLLGSTRTEVFQSLLADINYLFLLQISFLDFLLLKRFVDS